MIFVLYFCKQAEQFEKFKKIREQQEALVKAARAKYTEEANKNEESVAEAVGNKEIDFQNGSKKNIFFPLSIFCDNQRYSLPAFFFPMGGYPLQTGNYAENFFVAKKLIL